DGGKLVLAHRQFLPFARPSEDGEVGDREAVAGDEIDAAPALTPQLAVEHAIEAPGLVDVTLHCIRVRIALGREEVLCLAQIRSEAADLPKQPLIDLDTLGPALAVEAAVLFGEVFED